MKNLVSPSGSPPSAPCEESPAPLASPTIHCPLCIQPCPYKKVTSLVSLPRAPAATSLAFCILSPLVHVPVLSCDLCLCHFNESFKASFELLVLPSLPSALLLCPTSGWRATSLMLIPSGLSRLSSFSLLFAVHGPWRPPPYLCHSFHLNLYCSVDSCKAVSS